MEKIPEKDSLNINGSRRNILKIFPFVPALASKLEAKDVEDRLKSKAASEEGVSKNNVTVSYIRKEDIGNGNSVYIYTIEVSKGRRFIVYNAIVDHKDKIVSFTKVESGNKV